MEKKIQMGVCPGCKKAVEKTQENKVEGKNNHVRYWHPECLEKARKEKEKKTAEEMGRKAIFNYLTAIGMPPNYAFWGRQRNDYINKYGYTDSGYYNYYGSYDRIYSYIEPKSYDYQMSNAIGYGNVNYRYDTFYQYYITNYTYLTGWNYNYAYNFM